VFVVLTEGLLSGEKSTSPAWGVQVAVAKLRGGDPGVGCYYCRLLVSPKLKKQIHARQQNSWSGSQYYKTAKSNYKHPAPDI
jgi:hypothetical protein